MNKFSRAELEYTLKSLNLHEQDCILLHTSLYSLGLIEDCDVRNIPDIFFSLFKNGPNDNMSIFVPVFNYDFPKNKHADLTTQKTTLGIFPEWFSNRDDVVRSQHPMFSIAGVGSKANQICRPDVIEYKPFGLDSTFQRLLDINATIVFQGIGLKVCTAVVHCEALLNVKYRFYKYFEGDFTMSNKYKVHDKFYHFCFPMNGEYREDYSKLEKYLLQQGIMSKKKFGRSFIMTVKFKDLFDTVKTLLENDPFSLLSNKPLNFYKFVDDIEKKFSTCITSNNKNVISINSTN